MISVRFQPRCVYRTHATATSSDGRPHHVHVSSTPCALTGVSAGHPPRFKTSSDRSRPTLADVHLSCIQLLHLKSTDRSEQESLWYLLQTLCDGLKSGLDYSHGMKCRSTSGRLRDGASFLMRSAIVAYQQSHQGAVRAYLRLEGVLVLAQHPSSRPLPHSIRLPIPNQTLYVS